MIPFVCVSLQSQSNYIFSFYAIFTNGFNWIRKISLEKELEPYSNGTFCKET